MTASVPQTCGALQRPSRGSTKSRSAAASAAVYTRYRASARSCMRATAVPNATPKIAAHSATTAADGIRDLMSTSGASQQNGPSRRAPESSVGLDLRTLPLLPEHPRDADADDIQHDHRQRESRLRHD